MIPFNNLHPNLTNSDNLSTLICTCWGGCLINDESILKYAFEEINFLNNIKMCLN